jgi:hypothetical protein
MVVRLNSRLPEAEQFSAVWLEPQKEAKIQPAIPRSISARSPRGMEQSDSCSTFLSVIAGALLILWPR